MMRIDPTRGVPRALGLVLLVGAVGIGRAVQLSRGGNSATSAPSRDGRVLVFWSDGAVKSDVSYRHDVYDGESRTYYESGAPYERRHYVAGH